MAFLSESGQYKYFIFDRYIGAHPSLKRWIYITTDPVETVLGPGYIDSRDIIRVLSAGDFIQCIQTTNRNDLSSTQQTTFNLRVVSKTTTAVTLADIADDNPGTGSGGGSSGSVGSSGDTVIPIPQGRLTLNSGAPVMVSDATAATTIYYLPYNGILIPYWDGEVFQLEEMTSSGLSLALDANGAHTANHAANGVYDVFAVLDGATQRLATREWTSATSRAVSLTRKNGLLTNSTSTTMRYGSASGSLLTVGTNNGTYLGTFSCTGTNGETEFTFKPNAASGGSNNQLLLWNMYNRVRVAAYCRDSDANWDYTLATIRAAHGSNSNRITVLAGLQDDSIEVYYAARASNSSAGIQKLISIGVNSTSAEFLRESVFYGGAAETWDANVSIRKQADLGRNFYQALERSAASGTTTWVGSGGLLLSVSFMM